MDEANDNFFKQTDEENQENATTNVQPFPQEDPNIPLFEKENEKQKLKAAMYFFVSKICENEAAKLHMNISKRSIAIFNEILIGFAEGVAKDLELFARHAKRSTIKSEDVLLCARKSQELSAKLTRLNNELQSAAENRKRGRKRKEKIDPSETATTAATTTTVTTSKSTDQVVPPQMQDFDNQSDSHNYRYNENDDFEQPKFKKTKLNVFETDKFNDKYKK